MWSRRAARSTRGASTRIRTLYLRAISAKNFKKTMHARQQNHGETGVTSEKPVLLSFPGGVVKPHEAERWQRSLQSVQVAGEAIVGLEVKY